MTNQPDDQSTETQLNETLRALTFQGLAAIADSSSGLEGFHGGVAYYDPQKDELVTKIGALALLSKLLKTFRL
jgi:hypothetical protein